MQSHTFKHTLTGLWDKPVLKETNWNKTNYSAVIMFFTEDINIRWQSWEEEILIEASLKSMTFRWIKNNNFPVEIKGTAAWILQFLTL